MHGVGRQGAVEQASTRTPGPGAGPQQPPAVPSSPEPDTGPVVTTRPDLPALDALRGVAAVGVVLVHVAQVLSLLGRTVRWAAIGDAGVSIFFVISGYLITTSVITAPRFDRRDYLVRRATRIVPLYYASIVVALLFVDSSPLFTADGRADVATHLVFLHGLAPGMRYSINGVWWTLTVEVLFYLFVGLLGPVLRDRRWTVGVGAALVVLGPCWRALSILRSDGDRTLYLFQQLPGVADLFGLGMILAAVLSHPRALDRVGRPVERRVLLVVSGAALVAAMAVYYRVRLTYMEHPAVEVLWPFGLGVAVTGCLAAIRGSGRWLHDVARWSGLAFLGTVSYGLYLFHPFVMRAIGQNWLQRDPDLPAVVYALASLAGAVVVATLFHYSIERPAMRWGRGRTRRTRTPVV